MRNPNAHFAHSSKWLLGQAIILKRFYTDCIPLILFECLHPLTMTYRQNETLKTSFELGIYDTRIFKGISEEFLLFLNFHTNRYQICIFISSILGTAMG